MDLSLHLAKSIEVVYCWPVGLLVVIEQLTLLPIFTSHIHILLMRYRHLFFKQDIILA